MARGKTAWLDELDEKQDAPDDCTWPDGVPAAQPGTDPVAERLRFFLEEASTRAPGLTPRHREALVMLALRFSYDEIRISMNVERGTACKHIAGTLDQLGWGRDEIEQVTSVHVTFDLLAVLEDWLAPDVFQRALNVLRSR